MTPTYTPHRGGGLTPLPAGVALAALDLQDNPRTLTAAIAYLVESGPPRCQVELKRDGLGGGRLILHSFGKVNSWRVVDYRFDPVRGAAACRSCDAPIFWLNTSTGKRSPMKLVAG